MALSAGNSDRERTGGARKSHTGAFVSGAIIGAVAGAGLGAVAWTALACVSTAFLGLPAFVGFAAIGAASMAMYEGRRAVKRETAEQRQGKQRGSDRVAAIAGAGASKSASPEQQNLDEIMDIYARERYLRRWQDEHQHHHGEHRGR